MLCQDNCSEEHKLGKFQSISEKFQFLLSIWEKIGNENSPQNFRKNSPLHSAVELEKVVPLGTMCAQIKEFRKKICQGSRNLKKMKKTAQRMSPMGFK